MLNDYCIDTSPDGTVLSITLLTTSVARDDDPNRHQLHKYRETGRYYVYAVDTLDALVAYTLHRSKS